MRPGSWHSRPRNCVKFLKAVPECFTVRQASLENCLKLGLASSVLPRANGFCVENRDFALVYARNFANRNPPPVNQI